MTGPATDPVPAALRVVALAGGVGGARLAHGLQQVLAPGWLTVVVNTADDFELHGLLVCPDHDTVLYTLAGLADPVAGWGLAQESWTVMHQLERIGGSTWFRLGDRDLATHLFRTGRMQAGLDLGGVLAELQAALGVPGPILPMALEPVRTEVRTDAGWLDFQDYFVRLRQEPEVREVRFRGIEEARVPGAVVDAIAAAEVIVICPSNPIVSIGPIVAVPGLRDVLSAARGSGTPVVAVSPIVGGRALKGPADRMLAGLGHESSALGVARLYEDLATHMVIDRADAALEAPIAALGLRPRVTDTIMTDDAARARLAAEVLGHARS